MSELSVSIVDLEPMTVATCRVVSESPEQQAWELLGAWAGRKGYLDDLIQHPVFGFNNPSPAPGKKEYGYEFWIVVPPGEQPADQIEIKSVPGGLYAVTHCRLMGEPGVMVIWKRLWDWVQQSGQYQWRKTHELEKSINPMAPVDEIELELYLPVQEKTV